MNKTFDFQRFSKYFAHDLVSAWRNSGLTVLITACMPVFVFVCAQLYSLVFSGSFTDVPSVAIIIGYIVSFCIVAISFPVRQYGGLTEKHRGSNWLLLPASRLEKFVSLLLVCCMVVPAVWLAVMAACDGLLALLFGNYPGFVLSDIISSLGSTMAEIHSEGVSLGIGSTYALWLSWCENVMFFALAAMCFRKNKVAYGVLTLFGIGMLLSLGLGLVLSGADKGAVSINEDAILRTLNVAIYGIYLIVFTILNLGIWFRIKTLKH